MSQDKKRTAKVWSINFEKCTADYHSTFVIGFMSFITLYVRVLNCNISSVAFSR